MGGASTSTSAPLSSEKSKKSALNCGLWTGHKEKEGKETFPERKIEKKEGEGVRQKQQQQLSIIKERYDVVVKDSSSAAGRRKGVTLHKGKKKKRCRGACVSCRA